MTEFLILAGYILLIGVAAWHRKHVKKIKVNPTKYEYIKYCYLYADDYSEKDAKEGNKEELLQWIEQESFSKESVIDKIHAEGNLNKLLWLLKNNKYKFKEEEIIIIKKKLETYIGVSLQEAYRIMEVLALVNKNISK